MVRAVHGRLCPRDIEFLLLFRTVWRGQIARRRVNLDGYNRIGLRKINSRFIGEGREHEPAPDGSTDRPSGETSSHGCGFVITSPDAGDQLGSVADEPSVPVIIGGPGLPGGRTFTTEAVK